MRRYRMRNLVNPHILHNITPFCHTNFIQHLQNSKHLNSLLSSHAFFLKSAFLTQTFLSNHLLLAYLRFNSIPLAHQLFDEMPQPNVVSWTSLMAGYVATNKPQMAVWLFTKMPKTHVLPNAFTFSTVINAASILAHLKAGKIMHAFVQFYGYQTNLIVSTSLLDMYGKSNDLGAARRIFDSMLQKNVVSWTSMITGYAQSGQPYEALKLFKQYTQIQHEAPNQYMLASVVTACANLGRLICGKGTHATILKRGHESNEVVATALTDMYAKCGCVDFSLAVFRSIRDPSVITYTSMIVSAAKHGLGEVSLNLFDEMILKGVRPNDVTFLGILYACSHSGLVDKGFEILNSMQVRYGVVPDAKHYTCVVDMLGRRGRLDEAYRLAKTTETKSDNERALIWGSLVSASRIYGRVDIAAEGSKWLVEAKQQVGSAYVAMSNTYTVAGNWDNAERIRSEMKREGVRKEPGCSWVEIKDSVYVFYARDICSCPRSSEVVGLLKDLGDRMKERGYVEGSSGLVFVDVEEETEEEMTNVHSERLALGFSLISIGRGETIRIMKNLRMCVKCHEAFKLISSIVDRDFVVRDVNRFHHFRDGFCSCKDYW